MIRTPLPPVALGLWRLSLGDSDAGDQLIETILFSCNEGIRLFDCSLAYANGRGADCLLRASQLLPIVQVSLTLPCRGKQEPIPRDFLLKWARDLGRIRVIVLQPKDKEALDFLPKTIANVQRQFGSVAVAISNLPPNIAVLALERIRATFDGELFVQLPANHVANVVNCEFIESFRAVGARIIGYGLLLGGKKPIVDRATYTYGKPTPSWRLDSELSLAEVEAVIRGAMSCGGCDSVVVGAQTLSQISMWAAVSRSLTHDN